MFPKIQNLEILLGSVSEFNVDQRYEIFDSKIIEVLQKLSQEILRIADVRQYPDLVAFAFDFRNTGLALARSGIDFNEIRVGRGCAFHITPSNVPLNFAYSLAYSMLAGNSNIVRLPTRNYPQMEIFIDLLSNILDDPNFLEVKNSILLVRYPINKETTDSLSALCDLRIIWGGDETISKVKESSIPIRSLDISFPNRFSASVLGALEITKIDDDKFNDFIERFFKDTYLFDQLGCSSPKLIFWHGESTDISKARGRFWEALNTMASHRYKLEPIHAISKYVDFAVFAAKDDGANLLERSSNFAYHFEVKGSSSAVDHFQGAFGTFTEFNVSNLNEIEPFVTSRFQTLTYFGIRRDSISSWIKGSNIKGIDRLVPVGQAFNMSPKWDGMDLIKTFSRVIDVH
jgi:Acyl-CoA reductase (LuxC)